MKLAQDELEQLDKMLATARFRFDRTLRCIQEYRFYFADRVRRSSNEILQTNDTPCLEHHLSAQGGSA